MNSYTIEKVEGFESTNSIKGETVESGRGSAQDENPDAIEHVYIVFEDGISIEDGIILVEKEVLAGGKLDVSRKDTTGNAVVAIVTTGERQQIETLEGIKRVKVEAAAEVKKNETDEGYTTGSQVEDADIIQGADTESNQVADSKSTQEPESATEAITMTSGVLVSSENAVSNNSKTLGIAVCSVGIVLAVICAAFVITRHKN